MCYFIEQKENTITRRNEKSQLFYYGIFIPINYELSTMVYYVAISFDYVAKAENIRWIPQIALTSQFANSIFLTYGEGWQNGTPFTFILVVGSLSMWIVNQKMKTRRKRIG